ncbi:MAG: hypothetical protein NTX42_10345 [Methanothrix sp.]|nr:hypothetical protein [Methanothrix sp.]
MSKFVVLDWLFGLVNDLDGKLSTGVTLFVNGTVISGDLIPPSDYFKGIAETLETSPSEPGSIEIANIMGKSLRESVEKAANVSDHPDEKDGTEKSDVIYLKNISLWSSSRTVTVTKSFLVLRVDAVDGFFLGKFSTT